MPIFQSEFEVRAPFDAVWRFHADPRSLPKVMTGPVRMRVDHVDAPLRPGGVIAMTMLIGPLKLPWRLRLIEQDDGGSTPMRASFTDEQVGREGPFARWRHTHTFEALGADRAATLIRDRIDYTPPLGALGAVGAALFGGLAMHLMFVGRRRATKRLLE
jgi:hypothetical protein